MSTPGAVHPATGVATTTSRGATRDPWIVLLALRQSERLPRYCAEADR